MAEGDSIDALMAGDNSADPALDTLLADLLSQWDHEVEAVSEEGSGQVSEEVSKEAPEEEIPVLASSDIPAEALPEPMPEPRLEAAEPAPVQPLPDEIAASVAEPSWETPFPEFAVEASVEVLAVDFSEVDFSQSDFSGNEAPPASLPDLAAEASVELEADDDEQPYLAAGFGDAGLSVTLPEDGQFDLSAYEESPFVPAMFEAPAEPDFASESASAETELASEIVSDLDIEALSEPEPDFSEDFPMDDILALLARANPEETPQQPPQEEAALAYVEAFSAPEEPAPAPVARVEEAPPPPAPKLAKSESLLALIRVMYERIEERKQAGAHGTDTRQGFVVFRLGARQFGVPIQNVLETDRLPRVTPLPYLPEYVRGVVNLRGEILPLIDLRILTGDAVNLVDGRMLVVRSKEGESPSGLVVDALGGIAWLERDAVIEARQAAAGAMGRWIQATAEHREKELCIVDLQRLFASQELAELRQA